MQNFLPFLPCDEQKSLGIGPNSYLYLAFVSVGANIPAFILSRLNSNNIEKRKTK